MKEFAKTQEARRSNIQRIDQLIQKVGHIKSSDLGYTEYLELVGYLNVAKDVYTEELKQHMPKVIDHYSCWFVDKTGKKTHAVMILTSSQFKIVDLDGLDFNTDLDQYKDGFFTGFDTFMWDEVQQEAKRNNYDVTVLIFGYPIRATH